MTLENFKNSLSQPQPPGGIGEPLTALWQDNRGNWDEAHRLVQWLPGEDAAWIHAYLHRKEPDIGNAAYWYSRANKSMPEVSPNEEWEQIAQTLLKKHGIQ